MAQAKKQPVSLDAILDSDKPVFVGFTHPVTDEPFIDADKVECGVMVTSNTSDACRAVTREAEKAAAKLKRGKRMPQSRIREFQLDMLVAATVEVCGHFMLEGEVFENTPESLRKGYDRSKVVFNTVDATVGSPEVFTKGAMEQGSE